MQVIKFPAVFSYAYTLLSAVNFYYCVMLRKNFVGSSRAANETDCLIVSALITEIPRRDQVMFYYAFYTT